MPVSQCRYVAGYLVVLSTAASFPEFPVAVPAVRIPAIPDGDDPWHPKTVIPACGAVVLPGGGWATRCFPCPLFGAFRPSLPQVKQSERKPGLERAQSAATAATGCAAARGSWRQRSSMVFISKSIFENEWKIVCLLQGMLQCLRGVVGLF